MYGSKEEFISPKDEHLSIRMRRLPDSYTVTLPVVTSAKGQTHPPCHRLPRVHSGPNCLDIPLIYLRGDIEIWELNADEYFERLWRHQCITADRHLDIENP